MNFRYHFLKALFWVLGKLPFWFYHGVSSVLGFLFYQLRLYRYHVVMDNLRKCFPDKSESETKKIARDFYRHFADLLIESIKAFGFSSRTAQKRYKINENPEVRKQLEAGRSLAVILPHFGNWEWSTQTFIFMAKRPRFRAMGIYKPLKDQVMDRLVKESRTRIKGTYLLSKETFLKEIVKHKDEQFMLGFAADQAPANKYNSYWMNFLGRETGVFFGVEKIAKMFNLVPVYAHVKKVARSKYEIDLEVICENPRDTAYGFITEKHMKLLEADIYQNPHLWLWTHKRWKRSKPSDFDQYQLDNR